jgi:ribosomal protein S12 methylthiotransferase accessory factor YcaO
MSAIISRSVAIAAHTLGSGGVPVIADGSGTDADPALAVLRALAETIERYSAGFWGHSLATCVLERAATVPEIVAKRVSDGLPVNVPADTIFLPYPRSRAAQDSVGLAAGRNLVSARRRALAERIERDVLWDALSGRQAPVGVRRVADDLWLCDFEGLLNHHVVCMLRLSPARRPFLTLGFGCSTSAATAADKARMEETYVRAEVLNASTAGLSQARSPLDRLLWSCANDPTTAETTARSFASTSANTQPRLRKYAWVEVTVPEARALGMRVIRVVGTGLGVPPLTDRADGL